MLILAVLQPHFTDGKRSRILDVRMATYALWGLLLCTCASLVTYHVASPLYAEMSSMVYGAFTFILWVACGIFASQEQSAGQLRM